MPLKTYKIQYLPNQWECTVEINEEFVISNLSKPDEPYMTLKAMEDMITYWTGGRDRIENNDGDIIKTFLQQLGREMVIILTEQRLNVIGVTGEFKNREGWCRIDGSWGIKLTSVDQVDVDWDDFDVEEV